MYIAKDHGKLVFFDPKSTEIDNFSDIRNFYQETNAKFATGKPNAFVKQWQALQKYKEVTGKLKNISLQVKI